jgi:MFS family permease
MADPRPAPSPPGVPAPVRGLAGVSLLNDFASEMVYPLLPALLTGPLGAGPLALGVLDGAADLTASVLRWWSGRLADRPGWRGRLIATGYGLAALLRPVIALAGAAWQVIGLRVLDRVGKGLRSPARDALIADLTPAPRLGRAFGLHRSADHLGAVLGALAAFALLRDGASVREVIGWSVVPGVLAVGLVGWVLRSAGDPAGVPPAPGPAAPAPAAPAVALVALALLTAARMPEALLLLRLQQGGVALAAIPLLWGVLHVVRSASALPAGRLADRFGSRAALIAGTVVYGGGLLALAGASDARASVTAFLVLGVATGLVEPAERVAVAAAGLTRRGRAFGTWQALGGGAALVAGLGLGWLYQAAGPAVALRAAAGLSVAALAGWLLLPRRAPGP